MARFENVISVNPSLEQKFGLSYLVRSGKTLHMAGILSADEATFTLVGANDMEAQLRHIYARMTDILERAGCTLKDVVSEINFTTDMSALMKAGAVRANIYRNAGAAPPVASAVQVSGFYLPGAMLEVHAIAEIADR